jgi:hypothetical protein
MLDLGGGWRQVDVYPGCDPTTPTGDVALLQLTTPTTAPAILLAGAGDLGLLGPDRRGLKTPPG